MANTFYPRFRKSLAQGEIVLRQVPVKAVLLIAGAYTFDPAHEMFGDLRGAVCAISEPLAHVTYNNGVFDATDAQFGEGLSDRVGAMAVFVASDERDGQATDRLILYVDSAWGLPFTPDGRSATVTVHVVGV